MAKFTNIFSQITIVNNPEVKFVENNDEAGEVNFANDFVVDKLSEPEQDEHSQDETDYIREEYLTETVAEDDESKTGSFPIKSQEEMNTIEYRLRTDENFREMIRFNLRKLKTGLRPDCEFTDIVERIIDRDLLHRYNWTGSKGKLSLKHFLLFTELLKEIVTVDQGPYEDVLSKAIASSHRRKNNQIYRKRRKTDITFIE